MGDDCLSISAHCQVPVPKPLLLPVLLVISLRITLPCLGTGEHDTPHQLKRAKGGDYFTTGFFSNSVTVVLMGLVSKREVNSLHLCQKSSPTAASLLLPLPPLLCT